MSNLLSSYFHETIWHVSRHDWLICTSGQIVRDPINFRVWWWWWCLELCSQHQHVGIWLEKVWKWRQVQLNKFSFGTYRRRIAMEADQSPVVTSTTGIPSWPSVSSCQKDLFQPEEGNLNHVNHPHCIEDIEASAGIPNLTLYNHLEQVNHLYIKVVPQYWLEREPPSKMVQALVNVYFVLAAVPANISHILVILAFIR